MGPLLICILFGWAWGALTPDRLSPDKLVNVLEKTGGVHPGYRRNHAKGLCVAGYFEGNGRATALSKADVFRTERSPVVGRFAIAGGVTRVPPMAQSRCAAWRYRSSRPVVKSGEPA